MLKNSKFVLFLSPYEDGQAGNFWTLLRMLPIAYLVRFHSCFYLAQHCGVIVYDTVWQEDVMVNGQHSAYRLHRGPKI